MADSLFPPPGSVKKLRAYYQDFLSELDIDHIRRELFGESDRAKVILSSTILEDTLDYRIEQSIKITVTPSQGKYIFRVDGPLGKAHPVVPG
jgi:hypothetical protein